MKTPDIVERNPFFVLGVVALFGASMVVLSIAHMLSREEGQ